MGFPFIAPLKKRLTEKFKEREEHPHTINQYKPFVLMSSAAVVVRNKTPEEVRNFLKSEDYGSDAYFGCVVGNTTDISRLYQTGKTIVGNDLNGKEIVVEGERNRRVSVPIISKVNIDTDGGNNTLKTAQIEIKIFTLKQLEMFELFFLRPSMNIVLEYGWSSDIRKSASTIDSKLFAKKNWEAWKSDYINLFSIKQDANTQFSKKEEYLKVLEKTDYEYDYMAGKVTNFTISPDEDGTYNVNLDISSGNELQLWVPVKPAKDEAKTNTQTKQAIPTYQQFIQKIAADLAKSPENIQQIFKDENVWKKELFNFGAYNLTQKDITASKTPYISVKFIISLINSIRGTVIDYTWKDSAGNDVIPITSREYIMSATEEFILPGDLPNIVVGKNKNNQDTIVIDVKSGKKNSLLINDKSFNFTDSISIYDYKNGKPIQSPNKTTLTNKKTGETVQLSSIGNLCNVFFNYDRFVEIWKSSYVAADIINGVLDSINNNMFGLCKLELQIPEDISASQPMEIVDRKLDIYSKSVENEKPYRFKVNDIRSIVKTFEFNMELSVLMQAQALYSTQLAVNEATKKGQDDFEDPNIASTDEFKSADLSYAKNQDGFFSINAIEYKLVREAVDKNLTQPDDKKPEDVEDKKLSEKIQSNYIKFKKNPLDKKETPKNYIYQDISLIQRFLRPVTAKESTALTYLDISFVIDGVSGLSCGEYFQISGIPEVYNTNGFFQITNVKQSIDATDWLTEIEAGYRLKA